MWLLICALGCHNAKEGKIFPLKPMNNIYVIEKRGRRGKMFCGVMESSKWV